MASSSAYNIDPMVSPTHHPAPVFRSSCDSCAASKIKCDQDKPACHRCSLSGATCIYGISRKHGPAGLHPRASRRTSLLPAHASAMPFMAAVRRPSPRTPPEAQHHHTMFPSSATAIVNGRTSSFDHEHDFSHFPQKLENWGANATAASELFDLHSSYSDTGCLSATLHNLSPSSQTSGEHDFTQSESGVMNAFGSRSRQQEPQSCSAIALATLDSLGRGESSTGIGSLASPMQSPVERRRMTASFSGPTSVDEILLRNKLAIANIDCLLECSCAQMPHQAMLYAAIISQALNLYQRAAGSTAEPVPCAHMLLQPSPSPDATERRPRSTMAPLPLTAGEFELNSDDRRALTKVLILSEIRKVEALIESLANKPRQHGWDPRVGDVYIMLGNWLKTELTIIVKHIQS